MTQHDDRGWNRSCVPIDINPSLRTQPMKGCTTPLGSTPPTLYEQQCGFFYVPQESEQWESCETGPTVYRPYPSRLECLAICRCHNKGSTFSSVILRPCVLVRPGFKPVTSRSADRGLSNRANQVAVTCRLVNIKLGFDRLIVWPCYSQSQLRYWLWNN